MTMQRIAAALQRVESVLQRRPDTGLHDDAPATATWQGATRVSVAHANGTRLATDMPIECGGTGDLVTPGWLFRAGLAACATTSIALLAAARGITLAEDGCRCSPVPGAVRETTPLALHIDIDVGAAAVALAAH